MNAILRVTQGPASETSLFVEQGQTVTVGRGEHAEFAVPEDSLLSSVHFSVKCEGGLCHIQDLESTNGTFVNNERVSFKPLHDGDLIQAGDTRFRVSLDRHQHARPSGQTESSTAVGIDTQTPSPVTPSPGSPAAASQPAVDQPLDIELLGPERGFLGETAAAVCGRFAISENLQIPPETDEPPEEYVARLADCGDDPLRESLTFLAYALPKRMSVWWAAQCIREVAGELPPEDAACLQAAETWVADPSNDDHRRQSYACAEKQEFGTAASWAAVAPYWSHGSMAPKETPAQVPPADDLTGKAVSGAVQMAAVMTEPEKAPEKHRRFVGIAIAVATGENTWKKE